MSNFAYSKSGTSGLDAWIYKSFGGVDEIYISVNILLTQENLDLIETFDPGSGSGGIISLGYSPFPGPGPTGESEMFGIYAYDDLITWETDNYQSPTVSGDGETFSPCVSKILEVHWDKGSTSEAWLDGASLFSTTNDKTNQATRVAIGQLGGIGGWDIYLTSVKFGTTRGGSEIFSDSFISGDFSSWTGVQGDMSIVAYPCAQKIVYLNDVTYRSFQQ